MNKTALPELILTGLVAWAISQTAFARTTSMSDQDFGTLFKKSDVIVIAHVLGSSKTTQEEAILPNISPPIPVLGLETKFLPIAILKGDLSNRILTVHHYRLRDLNAAFRSGPMLVSFSPNKYKHFLLFLKREEDGRYVPAGGQTDAAISIRHIDDPFNTPNELLRSKSTEDEVQRQAAEIEASPDAPLIVEFVKMEEVDGIRKQGRMKVTNKTSKDVHGYGLQLVFFNQEGKPFEISSIGVQAAFNDAIVGAGGESSVLVDGRTDNYETSRIEAVASSVTFVDGSKWEAKDKR